MAGTIVIDTLQSSVAGPVAFTNSSGVQVGSLCRAWINMQLASGATPTIRGSLNISSITRNGVGDYTYNFTTAMPDTNYAHVSTGSYIPGSGASYVFSAVELLTAGPTYTRSTTSFRVGTVTMTFNNAETYNVSSAFFR